MMYCAYYQGYVVKEQTWFLVAVLRSYEHLAFDRTFDKQRGLFEFFVPVELEHFLVTLLGHMRELGVVSSFVKLPNRLLIYASS